LIDKIKAHNNENFEVSYLMDKSIFNNYKDYFFYEQLSTYLENKKLVELKENTIIEIIENLPSQYMEIIDEKMEKTSFDIRFHSPQFSDKIINFGQKKINFKFLTNYEFVDMIKLIIPLILLNKDALKKFLIVRYYSTSEKTIILYKEKDIQKFEEKENNNKDNQSNINNNNNNK
jgi:hypothetical protein